MFVLVEFFLWWWFVSARWRCAGGGGGGGVCIFFLRYHHRNFLGGHVYALLSLSLTLIGRHVSLSPSLADM